jgi:diguanylate cyclase (GGDEF)-like protein/putative nucleotidyltransferase with HDIG domain
MGTKERLSGTARAYIVAVTAAGILAAAYSVTTVTTEHIPSSWYVLAVLTLLSGSFTVRIPTIPARLSVSETFVFAAVLMFGPAAATVIVVLDTLVISFWLGRRANPPSRLLFNVAAPAVAIWVAANGFYWATGITPLSITPRPIISLVFPLLGLSVVYFLLNSWLIAFAVAFQKHQSAFSIWRKNLLWLSLNYFSGASVAALLLPYLLQLEYAFIRIVGILLPLLAISYLTLKTALGRVEDANRHLGQLNRLYLSTIETLAMAIDAKDQITHGHIRRVQQYAVGLARHLGVTDGAQISAIEAASLLHDMGKLAVPEYILNKPGRLTPAEFEKMKAHASVGADILSAIDFPYPVVPIVRHHHESWDGSGYPDGLKGSAIPIGARILSVVDCFDALTSDRPYRPRLPDEEAIRILVQRRGSMYDPLVVDAFIQIHSELVPKEIDTSRHVKDGLTAITRGTGIVESASTDLRLDDISSSTEEMVVLYDLAKGLSGHVGLSDAADVIWKHMRRIVPASSCIFYTYDSEADELVAAYVVGNSTPQFEGIRIPRGQRLSGWVAANFQTIVNSDPVLDLGEAARLVRPRLKSCLATPLLADEQLVGVLSLYSADRDAFNEDHRRIIEVVARQVSQTVKTAVAFEARTALTNTRDQLTGLPAFQHLEPFIASEIASASTHVGLSIILVRSPLQNNAMRQSARVQGSGQFDALVQSIRKGLRGADILFRYRDDEFIVLLTRTEPEAAATVATRIASSIGEDAVSVTNDALATSSIGVATAPSDGDSMEALVAAARRRQRPAASQLPIRPSIH